MNVGVIFLLLSIIFYLINLASFSRSILVFVKKKKKPNILAPPHIILIKLSLFKLYDNWHINVFPNFLILAIVSAKLEKNWNKKWDDYMKNFAPNSTLVIMRHTYC